MASIQFAAQFLEPEGGFGSPEQKNQALQELYGIIKEATSLTAQDGYLQEVSRHLRVDEAAVRTDYRGFTRQIKNPIPSRNQSENPTSQILTNANLDILSLILLHPSHSETIANRLEPEWVDRRTPHASFLLKLIMEIREGVWSPEDEIPDELLENDQERKLYYQITNTRTALQNFDDPQEKIEECLQAFQKQYLQKQKAQIEQDIAIAQSPPENWDELKSLQSQKNKIRKLLQQLNHPLRTQANKAI
jgi:DNA primase